MYVAIGDSVLQIDNTINPNIIHLRDLEGTVTDLFIDDINQRLMITAGGEINVYSLIDGELLVELPDEPVIAGEEAFGFWHSLHLLMIFMEFLKGGFSN